MGATVALRDVVGKTLHNLRVAVIPLHRDFDRDTVFFADRMERLVMQDGLVFIHVFDEAPDPAGMGEVFALAGALVDELDLHSVVEE